MNWLALMKQVPPEIVTQIESHGDLQQFVPYFQKFGRFYTLAVKTPVGEIDAAQVEQLLASLDVVMNDQQLEIIADALRRFCPDPDQNLISFLKSGGLKQILAGIATPQENLDTDNAMRCPHCSGLIVRPEFELELEDTLRCQHCSGLIYL